ACPSDSVVVSDHSLSPQTDPLRRPRAHGGTVLPGVRREYRLGNSRRADARRYGAVVRERAVLDAEGKAGGWRFVAMRHWWLRLAFVLSVPITSACHADRAVAPAFLIVPVALTDSGDRYIVDTRAGLTFGVNKANCD